MSDCARPISTDRIERYYSLLVEVHDLSQQVTDIRLLLNLIAAAMRKALTVDALAMAWTISRGGDDWHFEVDCVEPALEAELKSIKFPQELEAIRHVVLTRQPMLIHAEEGAFNMAASVLQMGEVKVRHMAAVPMKSDNSIHGVALIANMKAMPVDRRDLQLVQMVCAELALRLETLALRRELVDASRRMNNFNLAKDRVIQRFSHELKTPLAVLIASLKLIKKRMIPRSDAHWQAVLTRSQRSLERLLLMEYELEDILREKDEDSYISPSVSGQPG